MPYQLEADEIRSLMQEVRGQLGSEVAEIVDNARQLTDWRYYVQAFPWGALAAAAALGYAAVPRRLESIQPDAETMAQLAKDKRLVVEYRPKGMEKPSAVASLVTLTGNMLLRAGLAYAGQHMGKVFGDAAAEEPAHEVVTS